MAEQLSQRLNQLANQYNPPTVGSEQHAPVALVDVEAPYGGRADDETNHMVPSEDELQAMEEHAEYTVGVRELALAEYERRDAQWRLHAATSIQRVYRGFRVRKAVLPLISRRKVTRIPSKHIHSPLTTAPKTQEPPNYSPTIQPSPPRSPLYYAKYSSPITPPQEPSLSPSYSPIASPPLQPDSMSVINIFTRGVLGGKYRISMEENGLLTLALNKQDREESANANQVRGVIHSINQSIGGDLPTSPASIHATRTTQNNTLAVTTHPSAFVPNGHGTSGDWSGGVGLMPVSEPDAELQITPILSGRGARSSAHDDDHDGHDDGYADHCALADGRAIPTSPPITTGRQASSPNSLYLQYVKTKNKKQKQKTKTENNTNKNQPNQIHIDPCLPGCKEN